MTDFLLVETNSGMATYNATTGALIASTASFLVAVAQDGTFVIARSSLTLQRLSLPALTVEATGSTATSYWAAYAQSTSSTGAYAFLDKDGTYALYDAATLALVTTTSAFTWAFDWALDDSYLLAYDANNNLCQFAVPGLTKSSFFTPAFVGAAATILSSTTGIVYGGQPFNPSTMSTSGDYIAQTSSYAFVGGDYGSTRVGPTTRSLWADTTTGKVYSSLAGSRQSGSYTYYYQGFLSAPYPATSAGEAASYSPLTFANGVTVSHQVSYVIDPTGHMVYAVDATGGTIASFNPSTGAVVELTAPAFISSCALNPAGTILYNFDGSGNLYATPVTLSSRGSVLVGPLTAATGIWCFTESATVNSGFFAFM